MINKKIHQIWVGPKKMPVEWMETWKVKNPSCEYVLWTENEIDKLGLKNKDKYDYYIRSGKYHGAADIARVEILEKFGGVYIDADSVCLRSIEEEEFMQSEFFAVWEYKGRIANGIIGSVPNHPILREYIEEIRKAEHINTPHATIGGTLLTRCVRNFGENCWVTILPTYSFYPKDYHGNLAKVEGECYAEQFWGTTNNLYKQKIMKNRIELAEYFNTLGFQHIVEVGVFNGYYAEILCQKNPTAEVCAIDCWQVYPGYRDHKFQSKMDIAEATARKKLAPYKCKIVKDFSVTAVKGFEDGSIDAVFIDGNHRHSSVKEDLEIWAPKVRIGGVVSGHDYYKTNSGNVGVIKAVDEYVKEHGYELKLTDWDRENPNPDDRQPSWFFIKTH